jgi:glycosyltransferase involved in cell wall biosynthesis
MTVSATIRAGLSILAVLASLLWIVQLIDLFLIRKRVVRLADLTVDPPRDGWPRLAVIFSARDEAAAVEKATRSMLAQDYPEFELIAVDDRSTDATGALLDALAAEDSRLRVVHIRELPPGWLGKNHALQAASDATTAPWMLFTDADVMLAPGTLRKALRFALGQGADLVTASPEVPTESFGERVFLSMFLLMFFLHAPIRKVENPDRRAFLGVGAFNLMRAEAFRAVGGFRRIALSVDDDMRLGQALKWAGYRVRVVSGESAVSVRWHVGALGMIRGLEKNFFAGINFHVALAFFGAFVILWVGAGPHVGLLVGPWWARLLCALGIGALGAILHVVGRPDKIRWYHALFLPLGALFCVVALVRSVFLTLVRRGVRWRGHLYSLAELRDHVRRRESWTRELWKSTR